MSWLGLDIGGANLKAAMACGTSKLVPFRFWVQRDSLEEQLATLINSFGDQQVCNVAATMTAELADCFESRESGVQYIVDSVTNVCERLGLNSPLFAATDCRFHSSEDAKNDWIGTAAANWAMLAKYASRFLPGESGVVVDMGSTTTDIIPVKNGIPVSVGKTDSQRLTHGELVYVGANRTPVCSLVTSLKAGSVDIPVAREFFATASDAMLIRGMIEEDPADDLTADGRPRTVAKSSARICRMICEDVKSILPATVQSFAEQILASIEREVVSGLEKVIEREKPSHAIVTGSGKKFAQFVLAKRYPEIKLVGLRDFPNDSAPAHAVAVLAGEMSVAERET